MLRNVLINKWILGSAVLLIIVAVSCYFWYQHETSPYDEEVAETDDLVRQKQITSETETDNMTEDKTNTSFNSTSTDEDKASDAEIEELLKEIAAEGKVSDEDIDKILKEVAAEEGEVKAALSAEEMAKQESQRKMKELWDKIGNIIQGAGGSIHTSTHPDEIQKVVSLIEEVSGGPTMLTQMHNFGMLFQNSVNSNGEVPTSEVVKMADYMEKEFSNTYYATIFRNMALYATLKGYEVINFNEIINADDYEEVLKAHYESPK